MRSASRSRRQCLTAAPSLESIDSFQGRFEPRVVNRELKRSAREPAGLGHVWAAPRR